MQSKVFSLCGIFTGDRIFWKIFGASYTVRCDYADFYWVTFIKFFLESISLLSSCLFEISKNETTWVIGSHSVNILPVGFILLVSFLFLSTHALTTVTPKGFSKNKLIQLAPNFGFTLLNNASNMFSLIFGVFCLPVECEFD